MCRNDKQDILGRSFHISMIRDVMVKSDGIAKCCCREPMTVPNDRFSDAGSVFFFFFFAAAVHLSGGRWNLPSALACPSHSSCS